MATSTMKVLLLCAALAATGAAALLAFVVFSDSGFERRDSAEGVRLPLPLAILGDSDSHSFQDRLWFPLGSPERGGEYRTTTFNWPEVLDRLRGEQIDIGEWGTWGPPRLIGKAKEILGLPARRPRKQDYQYNFALSGARCTDLNTGWRQVDRLLATMRTEPDRWRNAVVVIRIGVNSFGQTPHLSELAQNPDAPAPNRALAECVDAIRLAVQRIRTEQPAIRFVLVGIFDNTHWAKNLDKWRSAQELANIAAALDRFDDAIRALANSEQGLAFFDDRAWFEKHWGSRDADGAPNYRDVVLANGMRIRNSIGDNPSNAVVADGHAGTAWNALWAQALVAFLNDRFGTSIRSISDEEIASLVTVPPS